MPDPVVSLEDMTRAAAIDAKLEHLLAGKPPAGDPASEDISLLVAQINELFPEVVIPAEIADAHIAKIVETSSALEPISATQPIATAQYGLWARLGNLFSPLPRKIVAFALSLTAAFSGMAYAGVLPDPLQRTAADLGRMVGIELPDPDRVVTDGDDDGADEADDPGDEPLAPGADDTGGEGADEADQRSDDDGSSVSDGRGEERDDDRELEDDSADGPETSSNGDGDEGSGAGPEGDPDDSSGGGSGSDPEGDPDDSSGSGNDPESSSVDVDD